MREAAAQPTNAPPNWEHTLAQFESMPQELADLKRSLGEVLHRFEDALDHLGIEARRLSNEASALALVADRLQVRLIDLGRALGHDNAYRDRDIGYVQETRPPAPEEPQYRPSDQGVTIILAAVPGFQGLMDVQRALKGLSLVENASVVGFKNDEATLRVVLRQPASARQIVEGLQASIGAQVLIEEARPEAQRLRLRFVERESRR